MSIGLDMLKNTISVTFFMVEFAQILLALLCKVLLNGVINRGSNLEVNKTACF